VLGARARRTDPMAVFTLWKQHVVDYRLVNGVCCGEPRSKFIYAPEVT
jgi:hypothetical protein